MAWLLLPSQRRRDAWQNLSMRQPGWRQLGSASLLWGVSGQLRSTDLRPVLQSSAMMQGEHGRACVSSSGAAWGTAVMGSSPEPGPSRPTSPSLTTNPRGLSAGASQALQVHTCQAARPTHPKQPACIHSPH